MTKYRLETWNPAADERIVKVEYKGETNQFYIEENNRKTAKTSGSYLHFDTWTEAHAKKIERMKCKISKIRDQLERAEALLEKIESEKEEVTG